MHVRLAGQRLGPLYGLLIVLAAGCGGGPERPARAASPCSPKPGATVTCIRAVGAGRVRMTIDEAPQAYRRWSDTQVERIQATMEWAHTPSLAPHDVPGVGAGAFWVRGPRELVATDGRRLVTVRVIRAAPGMTARYLATKVARTALGPVRVPVRTGP